MVQNKRLILKQIPIGLPVPGQDLAVEDEYFDVERDPPPGGLIVKNIYASFDPHQRACMNQTAIIPFFENTKIGDPLSGLGLAKVIKSSCPRFKEGALISGFLPIQEYTIINGEWTCVCVLVHNPCDFDLHLHLGVLGTAGLTAFGSLYVDGNLTSGQTIFVSSAAGAVGHLVGQLAMISGLKVIGSVGSDEKLDYILNELHFDAGFNYKKENPLHALQRLTIDGLDMYFDNVGGEQLEAALEVIKPCGNIICCGMITEYDKRPDERYAVKNMMNVITKRVRMQGFVLSSYFENIEKDYRGMVELFSNWLKEKTLLTRSHVIDGIDNGPEGFVGMLRGDNIGKTVLKIADEDS